MRQLLFITAFLFAGSVCAQLAEEPDENGIRYGHMHLNVSDVQRHKQLWMEHFNATEADRGSIDAVKLPDMLILFAENEPEGDSRGSVMHHFGFKVRDIVGFLEQWRADGLSVDAEFTGAEGQQNAYVTMPDGVLVELQEDQALSTEVSAYHIHFFTPRYEELMDWYTDLFELEVRSRGSIETTSNVPGMNISFGDADEQRAPTQGRAIDHIGFEIENLEAFCQRLEEQGIEFDVPYREIESLDLAVAFFTDPAGGYIELTEGLDEF